MAINDTLPHEAANGDASERHVGLGVIMTFGLLISKPVEFIFVPMHTNVVNLTKFPEVVCKVSCL